MRIITKMTMLRFMMVRGVGNVLWWSFGRWRQGLGDLMGWLGGKNLDRGKRKAVEDDS